MAIDPTKAILFIEGNTVRYQQDGYNGIIKSFNVRPVAAYFQEIDVVVTLEDGHIRRIKGPSFSMDEYVK